MNTIIITLLAAGTLLTPKDAERRAASGAPMAVLPMPLSVKFATGQVYSNSFCFTPPNTRNITNWQIGAGPYYRDYRLLFMVGTNSGPKSVSFTEPAGWPLEHLAVRWVGDGVFGPWSNDMPGPPADTFCVYWTGSSPVRLKFSYDLVTWSPPVTVTTGGWTNWLSEHPAMFVRWSPRSTKVKCAVTYRGN